MAADGATASRPSPWGPLRRRAFRALWIAQFASNAGTWTQTVGAQWLMGDLGGGALPVALVQTATTLPVFLLVLPAGALGDIVDRRRLLLIGQALMVVGAAALAILTAADQMTRVLLLGLIALMGVGQALSVPSFQAIQPELVPREEIPQAALLNGANANVARAIGPALGGVLIAAVGPAGTFALNAVSFVGVLLVLALWRRPADDRPLGAEHIRGALRAGARYVRSAPAFGAILGRSLVFMLFASGLWALLPAVARGPLRLGPGGYGLLLGSLGAGAVAGAFVVPRLSRGMSASVLVAGATLVYAGGMLVVGLVDSVLLVVVVLPAVGLAWIAVQSTLGAAAQVVLPDWARARALAYFQLVFMGGQALGALTWGALAAATSLRIAFVAPAAGLVMGAVLGLRRLALHRDELDVRAAQHWPEPVVGHTPPAEAGPVLVTVQWPVAPGSEEAFVAAMAPVGRSRRRTGAALWGLFQDAEDPTMFLETFTVKTWHEHLRQHLERGTVMDQELERRARDLLRPGEEPRVRHLLSVYGPWLRTAADAGVADDPTA
ncbi:MAG: family transporter [Conexibacter sp.]|nr:family transporter [Conexibacter sp.]